MPTRNGVYPGINCRVGLAMRRLGFVARPMTASEAFIRMLWIQLCIIGKVDIHNADVSKFAGLEGGHDSLDIACVHFDSKCDFAFPFHHRPFSIGNALRATIVRL
jgi:hypothetical protein